MSTKLAIKALVFRFKYILIFQLIFAPAVFGIEEELDRSLQCKVQLHWVATATDPTFEVESSDHRVRLTGYNRSAENCDGLGRAIGIRFGSFGVAEIHLNPLSEAGSCSGIFKTQSFREPSSAEEIPFSLLNGQQLDIKFEFPEVYSKRLESIAESFGNSLKESFGFRDFELEISQNFGVNLSKFMAESPDGHSSRDDPSLRSLLSMALESFGALLPGTTELWKLNAAEGDVFQLRILKANGLAYQLNYYMKR